MSNIVEVRIIADVPFDWVTEMPDEEVACLASVLVGPSMGTRYKYEDIGYVPNDHGGQTSMYRLSITGTEALSWPFMARIARALGAIGTLQIAEAKDVQWENEEHPWELIVPVAEVAVKPS